MLALRPVKDVIIRKIPDQGQGAWPGILGKISYQCADG
jgi:hypothetical protein